MNLADALLLFGGRRLAVLALLVKLLKLFALFFVCSLFAELVPEWGETLEKFLRVRAIRIVNLAVLPKLESLEEAEKFGEGKLTEDFMREDQLGGLLDLVLTGRVVDAKEGEGLGDVEAEPESGCFFSPKPSNVMKRGCISRYRFLDTRRLLIAADD